VPPVLVEALRIHQLRQSVELEQNQLRNAVHSLKEVDISKDKMPTYRGVPLTAFKPDDLIRIVKQQMEAAEAYDMVSRLI